MSLLTKMQAELSLIFFQGEGALDAAILFNALILFGFLIRFYRRNISPIRTKTKQASYWKNAWNFITFSLLFLILGSLLDILKFANVSLFYGIDLARSLFDVGFLAFLLAGIHMIRKRFR